MKRPFKLNLSKLTPSLLKLCSLSAFVLTSALFNLACDSTARITIVRVAFDKMSVVSATPVKLQTAQNGNAAWVPACNGDATHTRFNFNLRSTARKNGDQDLQIRPGDLINTRAIELGRNLAASNFDLTVSCVQEHGGTDSAADACSGANNPPAGVVTTTAAPGLGFVDNHVGNGRDTNIGVAFLIDQSGSINGKVDAVQPAGSVDPACIEGASGFTSFPNPLENCATDPRNYRLSAASNMIRSLNPEDRHIVFGYSEEMGVSVACNIPGYNEPWKGAAGATLSEVDKQNNCYSNDKRYTVGASGAAALDWPSALTGAGGLQGKTGGRTNLWTAIKTAFDYMTTRGEINRHIVVFADGPDTCQPGVDYQHCLKSQNQLPCANSVDYAAAKQAIADYQASLVAGGYDPVLNGVHISFIHIQARGYKEASPQMQELACLTGGHYRFINAARLSYAQLEQRDPIEQAANELRLTFGGYYGLVADLSPLSAAPGTPGAAAVGTSHAISGNLRLDNTLFTDTARDEKFSWGPGAATETLPGNYDARLIVHRPCTAAADCGNASGAECTTTCDVSGTRSCRAPATGSACGGNTGVCCGAGNCATGLTICNDTGVPLSCP